MHRWWGSREDSDRQSSERDRRAARRTIDRLPKLPSDDDEDFHECDLSSSFLHQVDGNDSDGESDSGSGNGSNNVSADNSAIMPATPFDTENGTDDDDYYKKLGSLKNREFNKTKSNSGSPQ